VGLDVGQALQRMRRELLLAKQKQPELGEMEAALSGHRSCSVSEVCLSDGESLEDCGPAARLVVTGVAGGSESCTVACVRDCACCHRVGKSSQRRRRREFVQR